MTSALKNGAQLLVFLLLGLGLGWLAMQSMRWMTPHYSSGDFSQFYTQPKVKVVVFGTAWCQFCKKTRAHLQQAQVAFIDADIETSKSARAQYTSLQGEGVPVILIGARRINGYDRAAIDEALAQIR